MWRPDTRVVAAVSGGSDSVALLLILVELHHCGELRLDAVAHLNHAIRGLDADEDETFCRALADRLCVDFVSARADVPGKAARDRVSVEMAARRARRAFLDEVRVARSADVVATAHTLDDQAETVLLRVARGTGLRGLAGIAPTRDRRIRPLLECSRERLRQELRERAQPWREDVTNEDLRNPRNRVRHELLPLIQAHFNPSAPRALARLADLVRADDAHLRREAAAASVQLVHLHDREARLHAEGVCALPESLARRVVQHAIETLTGRSTGRDDVDAVRDVAAGLSRAADLAGCRAERVDGVVVLAPGRGSCALAPFSFDLSIPGVVWLPGGEALEAEGPRDVSAVRSGHSPDEVHIDAAGLGDGLVVRSRRPGDRIQPLGLDGRKKVQDIFVDRKVHRERRDHVPIVTDSAGRMVWVVGHTLGAEFRVTERTKSVIILKLRRI
jgi:tRNA(Ile)-lysidine synthase